MAIFFTGFGIYQSLTNHKIEWFLRLFGAVLTAIAVSSYVRSRAIGFAVLRRFDACHGWRRTSIAARSGAVRCPSRRARWEDDMTDPAMPAEDATRIRSVGPRLSRRLPICSGMVVDFRAGRKTTAVVWRLLDASDHGVPGLSIGTCLRFGGLGSALLAIASAAGLLGIVPFAYLSIRATKELRRAGIRVGLLGPRVKDLPALSQEVGKAAK